MARCLDPECQWLVEIGLLGSAVALWLEGRGHPALHAATLLFGRGAVGFLAPSTTGKSTLAASLVAAGQALLTDDILVLERTADGSFRGRPSYPSLRLRDESVPHFTGLLAEDLPRLHPGSDKRRVTLGEGGFGRFHDRATPLVALYLLERGTAHQPVAMVPLSSSAALIELLRHSFLPRMVQALGLGPARLEGLAQLVERVPVRRLIYPTGFDRLAEVRAALVAEHGP